MPEATLMSLWAVVVLRLPLFSFLSMVAGAAFRAIRVCIQLAWIPELPAGAKIIIYVRPDKTIALFCQFR